MRTIAYVPWDQYLERSLEHPCGSLHVWLRLPDAHEYNRVVPQILTDQHADIL